MGEKVACRTVELDATLRLEVIHNGRHIVVAVDHQEERCGKQHASIEPPWLRLPIFTRKLPLILQVVRELVDVVCVGGIHMRSIDRVPVRRRFQSVCVEPLETRAHDSVALGLSIRLCVHKETTCIRDKWIHLRRRLTGRRRRRSSLHENVDAHLKGPTILFRLVLVLRAPHEFVLHCRCVKLEIIHKILAVRRRLARPIVTVGIDDRVDVNRRLFPVVLQVEHDLQLVGGRRL